ncbi:MAG: (Fe-S)-binding protein [Nitrospirota bacterium]|nr:(Fe-S)-binding protein [Nitrospirota bacterium]
MKVEQSKYLAEVSRCVRCGSCKAFCPTYNSSELEAFGARGRLRLLKGLLSGQLQPSPLLNDRIFSCLLCGACDATCPLGVDISGAIYYGRRLLHKTDKKRRYLRALVKFSAKRPELSLGILRMSQNILLPALVRRGIIPFNPEVPDGFPGNRDQVYSVPKKRGRVAIFMGCSVNFLLPHLGEALINVLKKLGYEVIVPKGSVCCGTPLHTLGLEEEAAKLARKNLQIFSRLKVEAILSLCPTCTLALKTEYPKMTGEGLENVMDISVFFNDRLEFSAPIDKTSVYHDPCHLYHGLNVRKEPREIIGKAGIGLIDMEDRGCCGFGGLFCLSNKEISGDLLNEQTEKLMNTGADTVITSCPGCMLQLSRTITDRPVLHLVELIEEAYCFRQSGKEAEG